MISHSSIGVAFAINPDGRRVEADFGG